MTKELPPQYNPKEVEDKIYRLWEESGFFKPDNLPKAANYKLKAKSYVIVVPPPNVTGSLHLGHALNATIQDILIRKKRMEGYQTLWLPGTDHAGIATQSVVEKELKKEGKTRYDLGRERLIERVWQWKEKYGNIILDQFKKLGSSMDWSRTRFTMDEDYQKAVEKAFVHYYEKGWIYRAERVINWCPRCQTSLSDLELEYKEVEATLYYIRYPFVEKSETRNPKPETNPKFIIVATTRPETMLGDAAVAVNPKDERYIKLVGLKVILPIQNREIPIVADEAVEREFGTGAVKVTPAHDLLDAEIAERHNLPRHTVIDALGKMTAEAGAICEGLKVNECREKVINELKKQGFLEKEEPYKHNVAVCYRCGTTIEPIPSKQWFLKMKELARMAIDAVKSEKVKFYPGRWQEMYLSWLEHVRDWTISRQIWWGHRIPLGYCIGCGEVRLKPEIRGNWFFVRHGETDWNVIRRIQGQSFGVSLNETGQKQAKEAAIRLKQYDIDLVISSDLTRAKETAEIIVKELGVEVIFDKALRERNYGVLEGLTREEIEEKGLKHVREHLNENGFVPPEGESLAEVEKRVYAAFKRHKDYHEHKNIVIVSHGAALKSLLRRLRNLSPESVADMVIHNADILHFSITEECKKCGSDFVELDNDVLDTWFSSALWPFATLGWSRAERKSSDLDRFYPTGVLSTARDIINLWVTRMIFSGMEFTGKVPFHDVIIHATILTKQGKRMSKSLGTGVDPMVLINKYGADALRFGLIWQAMGGQDIRWSEEHVLAGKKFANKLWNSARFVLHNLQSVNLAPARAELAIYNSESVEPKTLEDGKILSAFEKTQKETEHLIDIYDFGQALHRLYDFYWHEFCDIYIEVSKKQMANTTLDKNTKSILIHILGNSLKLLHPFMPFITEEIWAHLPKKDKKLLLVEEWPA